MFNSTPIIAGYHAKKADRQSEETIVFPMTHRNKQFKNVRKNLVLLYEGISNSALEEVGERKKLAKRHWPSFCE